MALEPGSLRATFGPPEVGHCTRVIADPEVSRGDARKLTFAQVFAAKAILDRFRLLGAADVGPIFYAAKAILDRPCGQRAADIGRRIYC